MTVERGERWQRPEPYPHELTSVYLERMVDSLEEYANELFDELKPPRGVPCPPASVWTREGLLNALKQHDEMFGGEFGIDRPQKIYNEMRAERANRVTDNREPGVDLGPER